MAGNGVVARLGRHAAFHRTAALSRFGDAPNMRVYSRLNCDAAADAGGPARDLQGSLPCGPVRIQ